MDLFLLLLLLLVVVVVVVAGVFAGGGGEILCCLYPPDLPWVSAQSTVVWTGTARGMRRWTLARGSSTPPSPTPGALCHRG